MTFEVESVNLLRVTMGTDEIYFNLTEETARAIHGDLYPVFVGANLRLTCTKGRGEEVLAELGVDPDIVKVIDNSIGEIDLDRSAWIKKT